MEDAGGFAPVGRSGKTARIVNTLKTKTAASFVKTRATARANASAILKGRLSPIRNARIQWPPSFLSLFFEHPRYQILKKKFKKFALQLAF